jgi:hypothetical protein
MIREVKTEMERVHHRKKVEVYQVVQVRMKVVATKKLWVYACLKSVALIFSNVIFHSDRSRQR